MTYIEFKTQYETAFKNMMRYGVDQAGSGHYAQEMADLSHAHPQFEIDLQAELEAALGKA